MKRWKKYPFFFMVLISSLVYGGGRLLEREQEPEIQRISVSPVSKGNAVIEAEQELPQKEQETPEAKQETPEAKQETPEAKQEIPEVEQETPEVEPVERQFQRVEMDYLDDALFIGDSRTSTLYEYAGWENTDFFVKYGQTVWDVWDSEMDGVTLEQMLTNKKYGKIYLMLGINELGTGTPESFASQFGTVVARVQQLQPDAVIFVQSIMHVTQSKDAENTYINNQEINARNERLKMLADNKSIFYIDENEVMDDPGTGKLKEEYSFDGVHLQVKYIDVWREFLLNHGIK